MAISQTFDIRSIEQLQKVASGDMTIYVDSAGKLIRDLAAEIVRIRSAVFAAHDGLVNTLRSGEPLFRDSK